MPLAAATAALLIIADITLLWAFRAPRGRHHARPVTR